MRGFNIVLVASAFVPFATLCAQGPLPIEPGARVRVTAADCGLSNETTTLEAFRGDTLMFPGKPTESSNPIAPITCPLPALTRIEVSPGRKTSFGRVLAGAGLGLLGGGLAGVAIGATGDCNHCDMKGYATAVGGLIGAGGGLVVGSVIGALIKTDRWEEVPLDRLRVGVAPQRRGGGVLVLRLTF